MPKFIFPIDKSHRFGYNYMCNIFGTERKEKDEGLQAFT